MRTVMIGSVLLGIAAPAAAQMAVPSPAGQTRTVARPTVARAALSIHSKDALAAVIAARKRRTTLATSYRAAPLRAGMTVSRAVPAFAVKGASPAVVAAATADAMKGWTPITDGPTLGGGALVLAAGRYRLIATGPDQVTYGATLDPATMTVDPTSWTKLRSNMAGEIACVSDVNDHDLLTCAGGNAAGQLRIFILQPGPGGQVLANATDPLSGVNGAYDASQGARRPLVASVGYCKLTYQYTAECNSTSAAIAGTQPSGGWQAHFVPVVWSVDDKAGLTVSLPDARGVSGCDSAVCAYRTAAGRIAMTEIGADTNGGPADDPADYFVGLKSYPYDQTVNPAPGGDAAVTIRFAGDGASLLMAQRGTGGHLWTTMVDPSNLMWSKDPVTAAWVDNGGSIRADSSPSCEVYNATFVCVIQGADSRLYARVLPTTTKGL